MSVKVIANTVAGGLLLVQGNGHALGTRASTLCIAAEPEAGRPIAAAA